jgi:phosphatidylinositol alpha-mannosyltransferase
LRICQVTAGYHPYPSGVSEYVSNLTRALRARGHEVHVLTTGYDRLASLFGPTRPEPDLTRIGQAWLLPMNRSFATVPLDWHMSGKVKRFLAGRELDVVHLNGFFPPDISFYALKHSRAVNVLMFHTVGFTSSPVAAWLFRQGFARYHRRLHGRIAATEGARRFIAPYFPGEIRVVHEGVDTARFRPEAVTAQVRSGPQILFVGRLDSRKGLSVLLNALPLVRKSVPSARLTVVGTGPLEPEACRLVARLGLAEAVRFVGASSGEALPALYASTDVYCAPTLGGEAFGIVLLEAMASGAPVVCSDITGYNEVVTHEQTGLLCPPGNPTTLAAALVRVLSDGALRDRLRQNGLAWAEQHSWSNIAAQTETYYFELLGRRT